MPVFTSSFKRSLKCIFQRHSQPSTTQATENSLKLIGYHLPFGTHLSNSQTQNQKKPLVFFVESQLYFQIITLFFQICWYLSHWKKFTKFHTTEAIVSYLFFSSGILLVNGLLKFMWHQDSILSVINQCLIGLASTFHIHSPKHVNCCYSHDISSASSDINCLLYVRHCTVFPNNEPYKLRCTCKVIIMTVVTRAL